MKLYIPALLALAVIGCQKDPNALCNKPDAPRVSVGEDDITRVSMLISASFGEDMSDITSYGVEISDQLFENGGPVTTLTATEGANGFTAEAKDLKPNSTYYLRAFISNGHSKLYSSVVDKKTPETSVATLSNVTIQNGMLTATIEDNGGRVIEDEVGFVWGKSNDRKSLRREKRHLGTLGADGKTITLPVSEMEDGTRYVLAYAEDDKSATGFSLTPFQRYMNTPETMGVSDVFNQPDGQLVRLENVPVFASGERSFVVGDDQGRVFLHAIMDPNSADAATPYYGEVATFTGAKATYRGVTEIHDVKMISSEEGTNLPTVQFADYASVRETSYTSATPVTIHGLIFRQESLSEESSAPGILALESIRSFANRIYPPVQIYYSWELSENSGAVVSVNGFRLFSAPDASNPDVTRDNFLPSRGEEAVTSELVSWKSISELEQANDNEYYQIYGIVSEIVNQESGSIRVKEDQQGTVAEFSVYIPELSDLFGQKAKVALNSQVTIIGKKVIQDNRVQLQDALLLESYQP